MLTPLVYYDAYADSLWFIKRENNTSVGPSTSTEVSHLGAKKGQLKLRQFFEVCVQEGDVLSIAASCMMSF